MTTTRDSQLANGVHDKEFRFLWFSELLKRPVIASDGRTLGKLYDLVFRLTEPYPEAAGIYIEHGWGKPTEFVPWTSVLRIEEGMVAVLPPQ